MSGTAITWDTGGLEDILAGIARRAGDLTPAMQAIGEGLVTSTLQRFETETDPTGRPWRPLSIETILRRIAVGVKRQKKRPGKDGKMVPYGEAVKFRSAHDAKGEMSRQSAQRLARLKILQVLGHLRGSIHRVAGRDQVEVGSNLVYARIHQYGGQAGRGRKVTIPPRPFLGVDADDAAMILAVLRGYLGVA